MITIKLRKIYKLSLILKTNDDFSYWLRSCKQILVNKRKNYQHLKLTETKCIHSFLYDVIEKHISNVTEYFTVCSNNLITKPLYLSLQDLSIHIWPIVTQHHLLPHTHTHTSLTYQRQVIYCLVLLPNTKRTTVCCLEQGHQIEPLQTKINTSLLHLMFCASYSCCFKLILVRWT